MTHVDGGLQDQQIHLAEQNGQERGVGDKETQFKRTELEQELRYLRDPLKLAENTVSLLRQDDHKKALELVRIASRTMACTVSWNHIIDYDMGRGKVSAAIKTYNEVSIRLACRPKTGLTDLYADEETRATTRCLHLYYALPWSGCACPLPPGSLKSALNLQLHVR